MEVIRIAKEKGVKFGKPKVATPRNTNDILDRYINHETTNNGTASLIEVSRGMFFRLVRDQKTLKISQFQYWLVSHKFLYLFFWVFIRFRKWSLHLLEQNY